MRRGAATALTSDDSVVQRMVDAGLHHAGSRRESHPQKNQLIAALGIEDGVEPHTVAAPARPARGRCLPAVQRRLVGRVSTTTTIAAALVASPDRDDWLDAMQQAIEALAAPRQDNFSAIAVWVAATRASRRDR